MKPLEIQWNKKRSSIVWFYSKKAGAHIPFLPVLGEVAGRYARRNCLRPAHSCSVANRNLETCVIPTGPIPRRSPRDILLGLPNVGPKARR